MPNTVARETRSLLRLALPLAAAQAGTQLMSVVDVAIVGRVGAEELGAASLGISLFFAISIVGLGIVMGIDPLASQAVGSGDPKRARAILTQGLWLATIVGLVLSIPLALSPLLLRYMKVSAQMEWQASLFVWIRALGLIPFLMFIVVRGYLQALGITKPLLVAMIAANIFNLAADLLFVFGGSNLPAWSGPLRSVPAMGAAGAALATTLASVLEIWIVIRAVKRKDLRSGYEPSGRLVKEDCLRALKIGIPIGLHMGAEVGVFALAGLLAGRFGATALAAHQIVLTLASFTFTVVIGVGAAGTVRVGSAIGAGDQKRTAVAGYVAFATGALFMTVAAIIFWLAPRAVASLITNQSDVIAAAIPLFAAAAVFQIFDGIQGVGAGVLRGAGDTKFTFLANLVGHWVMGFPIAMLLAFKLGYGVVGLWWGLCAGLAAVAVILLVRFRKLSSTLIAPLHQPETSL
ncbi:MAG TPA: MATE family efflux transporter [Thermoanaerobaculia bacterium]|nr:MATE family efflux transporter [Thermoanaerobaculia bacterium]